MKKEDHKDITPKVTECVITDAKNGDRDAALQVLGLFVHAVKNGQDVAPAILTYLAEGFDVALESPNPNKAIAYALNLGRPSNRSRDLERDARDEALALEVFAHMRVGKTLDKAVHAVVEAHPRFSINVVKHAWRKFKSSELIRTPDPIPDN